MKQLLPDHSETLYIKHYFQKELRLGSAVVIILSLFVLGFLIPLPLIDLGTRLLGAVNSSTCELSLVFIAICLLAYSLPLYLFRFLMKRSSNDLYLSLPIERKRLFYVHYLIGLIYLAAVSLFLLLLFCLFKGLNSFDVLQTEYGSVLVYFILNCGFILLGCCLYTFFTYLVIRCHTLSDAMAMGIIYTLLPILIYICFAAFCGHVIDNTLVSVINDFPQEGPLQMSLNFITVVLSIPVQMQQWLMLSNQELSSSGTLELLFLSGIMWVIFALGCFSGAQKAFVRKRSEQCGQPSDVFFTYPLLIPLITFLLLLGLQDKQPLTIVTVVIALGYMLANFLAARRIHFSLRRFLLFIAMAAASYLLFAAGTSTNLLGIAKEMPEIEQIESVSLDITENYQEIYPNASCHSDDPQRMMQFLEGHGEVVELAKHQEQNPLDDWYYQISFRYVTKDNEAIYRLYVFPKTESKQVTALIKKWQKLKMIEEIYR